MEINTHSPHKCSHFSGIIVSALYCMNNYTAYTHVLLMDSFGFKIFVYSSKNRGLLLQLVTWISFSGFNTAGAIPLYMDVQREG